MIVRYVPFLLLAACGGATNSGNDSAGNSGESSNASAYARDDAQMANEAAAGAQAKSPQEFVDIASASDAYEIASSRMALTKATTPQVKQFAERMVSEHTASTAKLKQAAAAAQPAALPRPMMTPEQQADIRLLTNANGQAFEKAYIEQQIGAHDKTYAALSGYAANGTAPSLKAFAGETAPVVAGHLAMLRELGGALPQSR